MSVPPKEEDKEKSEEKKEAGNSNPKTEVGLHVPVGNFLQLEPLGESNDDPQSKPENFMDIFKNFKLLLPLDQQEQCREGKEPGKENSAEFDEPSLLVKFLSDNDMQSGKISCKDEKAGMECIGELASKFAGADVIFNIFNKENGKQAKVDGNVLQNFSNSMSMGGAEEPQSPGSETEENRTKAGNTPKPRPPGMVEE